jgi:DNA polymerase-3 subunit delta'
MSVDTATDIWSDLVGQDAAVATLKRAVAEGGHAMSHAWLITGPPGSGRSIAARAFAAALQCQFGGCGVCEDCRTVLAGSHPDVTLCRTEQLSIGVDEVRELVRKAAMSPARGRWQVVIIEDADRVTDRGADALLKSIEEPPKRTVWLLCAPNADDVIVTIRSRTRKLELVTPSNQAVADLLIRRDGIDPAMATQAARAAQGHIGRARRLATDPQARKRRGNILAIPTSLAGVIDCLGFAGEVVSDAQAEAKQIAGDLDAKEMKELTDSLGLDSRSAKRHAQAAINHLTEQQKARAKRLERDALDRVLTELTAWYRDLLSVQLDAGAEDTLVNTDQIEQLRRAAETSTPEQTLRRIDAILDARIALGRNVPSLLAMEALLLQLREP